LSYSKGGYGGYVGMTGGGRGVFCG
jgi:hypothetical protein